MNNIPPWVNSYIGIPYLSKGRTREGMDCLSLVEAVYKNVFNILLPEYNHVDSDNLSNVADKMIEEENSGRWIKLDKPESGCVVLMNIAGHPVHVGIVLNDNYMLHSLKGHNSVVEKFTGMKWNKRIEGFYAWRVK